MIRFRAIIVLFTGLSTGVFGGELYADEKKQEFAWKKPEIGRGIFTDELGMLPQERELFATNLAGYAVNQLVASGATEEALDQTRRLLGLAMQLAPRNRTSLVANYQLARGVLPQAVEGVYSDGVLANLLHTRARALRVRGDAESRILAKIFIELAAEIDPKNEDAVYAAEIQRLDFGGIDWSVLTDSKESKKNVKKGKKQRGRGGQPNLP